VRFWKARELRGKTGVRVLSDGRLIALPTAQNRSPRHHSDQWRALRRAPHFPEDLMNTIIYIVGLVVIIGFILSYFGFR
jgi:ADP-ribose pyrophosphatase YjhB (NUDIX family)